MSSNKKSSSRSRSRPRVSVSFTKPSMTKQYAKDECDIGNILRKYSASGIISHSTGKTPMYGDVISVNDFQSSMNSVLQATEYFNALPSNVRSKFHNDVSQFLAFANDVSNRDDLISMGFDVPPVSPPVSSETSDSTTDKQD